MICRIKLNSLVRGLMLLSKSQPHMTYLNLKQKPLVNQFSCTLKGAQLLLMRSGLQILKGGFGQALFILLRVSSDNASQKYHSPEQSTHVSSVTQQQQIHDSSRFLLQTEKLQGAIFQFTEESQSSPKSLLLPYYTPTRNKLLVRAAFLHKTASAPGTNSLLKQNAHVFPLPEIHKLSLHYELVQGSAGRSQKFSLTG